LARMAWPPPNPGNARGGWMTLMFLLIRTSPS
jgi:hypothetical protein